MKEFAVVAVLFFGYLAFLVGLLAIICTVYAGLLYGIVKVIKLAWGG